MKAYAIETFTLEGIEFTVSVSLGGKHIEVSEKGKHVEVSGNGKKAVSSDWGDTFRILAEDQNDDRIIKMPERVYYGSNSWFHVLNLSQLAWQMLNP